MVKHIDFIEFVGNGLHRAKCHDSLDLSSQLDDGIATKDMDIDYYSSLTGVQCVCVILLMYASSESFED